MGVDLNNFSYCGKQASDIMKPLRYSSQYLSRPIVTVVPGVVGTKKFALSDMTAIIQSYVCEWNPCGNMSVRERILEVCQYSIMQEECIKNLRQFGDDTSLGNVGDSTNAYLQPLVDSWRDNSLSRVGQDIDTILWQSDKAGTPPSDCTDLPLTLCDGWLKQFAADVDVYVTPAAVITAANVITELGTFFAGLNPLVISNATVQGQLRFHVPFEMRQMLMAAYANASGIYGAAQNTTNNWGGLTRMGSEADPTFFFQGIEIVFTNGLKMIGGVGNTTQMVCIGVENLWLGVANAAEYQSITQTNMLETAATPMIRFRADWTLGMSYGFGDQVGIYYTP